MTDAQVHGTGEVFQCLLRIALGFIVEAQVKVSIKQLAVEHLALRVVGRGGRQDVGRQASAAKQGVDLRHGHAPILADLEHGGARLDGTDAPGHAQVAPDNVLDVIGVYRLVALKLLLAFLEAAHVVEHDAAPPVSGLLGGP